MESEDLKTLNTLFNRNSLLNYMSNSKIIALSSNELKEINHLIKHPLFQTTLNADKVEDMKEKYSDDNKYSHHFLTCCMITIAHLIVGDKEDYYLVDGQHRVQMLTELKETKTVLVALINVRTKDEMDMLFKSINADSAKCHINDYPIFAEQMYVELKELMKNKYNFLPKSSSERHKLYCISEFIDKLIKTNIITITGDHPKSIFDFIRLKESEFFITFDYLSKYHQNKDSFKEKEIVCIENKSCMFMKRNNFFEWLANPNIEPYHEFRRRLAIPKTLQNKVWEILFNATSNGKCPIYNCPNILDKKVSNSWQCGHIISVMNGGETNLDNLRPICTPCNRNMGGMNWDDYIDKLLKDIIVEDHFNENETIKCSYKKCTILITSEDFYPHQYKTTKGKERLKPVCKKCYNIINS
jgi:5-methylcytosine-specific restriction endonuclease McrA